WSRNQELELYAAPGIYSGGTRLMTSSNIATFDFKELSERAGLPIMGLLGMDCLAHYCIQFDFTSGKLRFIDHEHLHLNKQKWGKVFPIVPLDDARPAIRENLLDVNASPSLIDTGYDWDGWLMPELFQQWT